MKKLFILVLIFSFCGGSSETQTIKDTTTKTRETNTTLSTTTTTLDVDLALKNFKNAWESNLGEPITLSEKEVEATEYISETWSWKGTKADYEKQYMYRIKVKDLECTRIWDRMGIAWSSDIHPVEKDYILQNTYKCDDDGEIFLYGEPFYFKDKWWIYSNIELDLEKLNCEKPCATSAQNFAGMFEIDKNSFDLTYDDILFGKQLNIYRANWEMQLEEYPKLTSKEYEKSKGFKGIEDSIYNFELSLTINNEQYDCVEKDSGMVLSAFANENHPIQVYEQPQLKGFPYQVIVTFICSDSYGESLYLYGDMFFQDEQWWTMIRYDETFHSEQGIETLAFMSRFVKRVSLGATIIEY